MVQSKEWDSINVSLSNFIDALYPVISPNSIWNGRYVGSDLFHVFIYQNPVECSHNLNLKKPPNICYSCICILCGYGRLSIVTSVKNCKGIVCVYKSFKCKTAFQNKKRDDSKLKEISCNSASSRFYLLCKCNVYFMLDRLIQTHWLYSSVVHTTENNGK